ncbi:MAG: DUF1684 domain-containing protein [bacterium]|nr:DUF1684 domain-containing protein [bacterium]
MRTKPSWTRRRPPCARKICPVSRDSTTTTPRRACATACPWSPSPANRRSNWPSASNTVPYVIKGKVTFAHEGKNHTLSVLGPADPKDGDYLWLPFYDETSGGETYGGGRYLDLELAADGTVEVDFNFAYNPLCDYNPEKYNCTLPPAGNRLPFAVKAGEKLFHAHE